MVQGAGMGATLPAEHTLSLAAAFLLMGVGSGASQIFLDSYFQEEAVDGYRGRVIAFSGVVRAICYISAGALGAAASGAGPGKLITAAALITAISGPLSKAKFHQRIRCSR